MFDRGAVRSGEGFSHRLSCNRPVRIRHVADPGLSGTNSVAEHHGSFAGILSTGIMGGAVVPLIIGRIGDHFGLRTGVAFLYVTFACVFERRLLGKTTHHQRHREP